ncbi:MAG TPA: CHASE domain-containing protein, partial [Bacillota bacterium]|nr:CHASE domain-containing protein [Bacillota bacterium]
MSPFADSQPQTKPSLLGRFTAQPALIVFLVCLLAGLGAVYWNAKLDETAARARARAEAQARGAALELEINQAISAAEALGTLARQYGGAIPNFQRIGTDLLATRPNLASLELQPGGIVSDIVPRPAQERALGRNLLNDPAQRPGLQAALQRRGLTVTGPTTLYRGEKGLIVRVPVFQRTRDNRESVWGFVAVSLRLAEAVKRAELEQLATHGYAYHLFAPASGQQPAVSIAAHGEVSSGAEQQPVRAQNLEMSVVLQPQGGWLNKAKLALEALGVLVVSGLVCLLVNLLESRNDMEGALTEANQRLARETADRKQAQEDARALKDSAAAAQTDLKQSRFALQQAEAKLAESHARLEAAMRDPQESSQAAQARLQEAEIQRAELQTRLETALEEAQRTAQTREAELTRAQASLQQAQAANHDLQTRLKAADQAQQESAVAAQTRREQDQATIAELHARLEATTRAASETAEASAAKLKEWEENQRDLEARLLAAEQATVQAAQLATRLEAPQAEAL